MTSAEIEEPRSREGGRALREVAFYFLRHGETDWNRERRVQGNTDVPLNATGIAQAEAARAVVRRLAVRTVCASPLRRARETAEIACADLGLPLVLLDDLREFGLGEREGHLKDAWFEDWRRGITPAGGEPYRDFLGRALRGVNRALALPGPVLIVAHGGTYWPIHDIMRCLEIGTGLPNCRAIGHEPPGPGFRRWRAAVLEPEDVEVPPAGLAACPGPPGLPG